MAREGFVGRHCQSKCAGLKPAVAKAGQGDTSLRKPASPFRYFNSSPEIIRLCALVQARGCQVRERTLGARTQRMLVRCKMRQLFEGGPESQRLVRDAVEIGTGIACSKGYPGALPERREVGRKQTLLRLRSVPNAIAQSLAWCAACQDPASSSPSIVA